MSNAALNRTTMEARTVSETAREVVVDVVRGDGDADQIIADLDRAGFVIVPKEPTEEMLSNGDAQSGDHPDVAAIYRAMIAAASQDK